MKKTKNRLASSKNRPRFRIERLEERIAPVCKLNPQGKAVGCCSSRPQCGIR